MVTYLRFDDPLQAIATAEDENFLNLMGMATDQISVGTTAGTIAAMAAYTHWTYSNVPVVVHLSKNEIRFRKHKERLLAKRT